MELRRAADALLRSQGAPLAAVLNSSTTVRWTTSRQLRYRCSSSCQSKRSLSTTSRRTAIRPLPTTSATPRPSDSKPTFSGTAPYRPPQPKSESKSTPQEDTLESLTASLGWANNLSHPSPAPRPFEPPAWADASRSKDREARLNGGTSGSDLLAALNKRRVELEQSTRSGSQFDLSRMMDPMPPSGTNPLSNMAMMSSIEQATRTPKPVRVPIKLNASTGRSVIIGAGTDVARGIRLMEASCARNRIRRDATNQRFHERAGLKRKRLRRMRWKKKFMEGFKATVGRVKQLKNQGW